MSLFQKKTDPFSAELKKLEEESRRVGEKMRRLEARLGEPVPEAEPEPFKPEQFKGAMFKDGGHPAPEFPSTRKSLKVQRRKMRNRVIVLGVVLLILLLLVLKTLT